MAVAVYPLMLYLAARCAWRAFAPRREPAPSTPLFEIVTSRWSDEQRHRILRLAVVACGLIVAMVGLSSNPIDVGYAVMEGATDLLHQLLPYGHIAGVLHGDTYPIGSYLLFTPFAAISPVHNQWDDAEFTLLVAVAASLLAALGIWRASTPQTPTAGQRATPGQRVTALRGVLAFLTFPPLLVTVSTGTTDVTMAAIMLAAILLWRRPAISTTVLAAGAWFKLAPAALLPLWLAPLRGGQLRRALGGIVLISALMLAPVLALGGAHGVARMLHAVAYQESRESLNGLWWWIGSVPLQQLAQAATLALIVAGAVRLAQRGELANDRTRLAALCAAIMLALQISASYWSYLYLVWVLPFLALSVLAADNRSIGAG
jgi:glycosyl transferase family 87